MFTNTLSRYFLRSTVAVSLALCGISAAAAAPASETVSSEVRVISTHGLDLTSEAGRSELRLRITKAARQVCAEVTDGFNPGDPDYRACFQAAFADGWKQAEVKIAAAVKHTEVASVTK